MFGFVRKDYAYPTYNPRPYIDDPVARMALNRRGIPLTSFMGGTGQMVKGSLNALNPAGYVTTNAQLIVSPYGRGHGPNYPPVLEPLTLNPDDAKFGKGSL